MPTSMVVVGAVSCLGASGNRCFYRVVAVDDAGHELGDTRPVVAAKVAFGVRDLRHAGSFRGR